MVFLVIGFCTHSCKEKVIEPPPNNNGYDSTLFTILSAKHKAQIKALEHERDSLIELSRQPITRYVYLNKYVSQDSSMLYQINLMSGLLTLHTLKDTAIDTSGTVLQRGNKRLIDYLANRDALELKDNIIKVQGSIIRSFKEQNSVDSLDRADCIKSNKELIDDNLDLSMKLEAQRADNDELLKKRNNWRIATLALLAKDTLMLLLRS